MRRASTSATVGSAAVNLFAVLFFLIVVAGSAGMLVRRLNESIHSSESREQERVELDTAMSTAIEKFSEDATPDSDAISDPIHEWCNVRNIGISDISSRIAPNWVASDLLRLPEIARLIDARDGFGGDLVLVLKQQRDRSGFFSDLESGYGAIFPKPVRDRYLTAFAYANINLTDEDALRRLYEVRTSDYAAAQLFQTKIRALRNEAKIVAEGELIGFLGADYDRLFPVVNALPCWNVNFLPLPILYAIISSPKFGIADPQIVCDTIDARRQTHELGSEELQSLIGLPAASLLYQYIGTATWFWQIDVHGAGGSLSVVLCRLPPEWTPRAGEGPGVGAQEGSRRRWFRVVSRRYSQ